MDDTEFQALLNAPAPLVVLPGKIQSVFLLIGGFLFAVASVWIVGRKDAPVGACVAGILFFGACVVIALRRLIYPEKAALILDDKIFTVRRLGGERSYVWSDVVEFTLSESNVLLSLSRKKGDGKATTWSLSDDSLIKGVLSILYPFNFFRRQRPYIRFRLRSSAELSPKASYVKASIDSGLSETGGILRDVYTISPARLVQLMNHWRVKASGKTD